MTVGVAYMTWGANAISQAEDSIATLNKYRKDTPVFIVGDKEAESYWLRKAHVIFRRIDIDPFDNSKGRGFKFMAGRIKPLLGELSPFEKTLYLDVDTHFVASPQIGFDMLDIYDLLIAETQTRTIDSYMVGPKESKFTQSMVGTKLALYHNSGMIFWKRNERTLELFKLWGTEWMRFQNWDEQVALLRAIYKSNIFYLTVPYSWNSHASAGAFLLHHWFGTGTARKGMKPKRRKPAYRPQTRLVSVEVYPGRFVKAYEGQEAEVRERYSKQSVSFGRSTKRKVVKNMAQHPKGPMVVVRLGPRKLVKMYESDAIAKKLPYEKERKPAVQNKMISQPLSKAEPVEPASIMKIEPDNFTEISGIGVSTMETLYEADIYTFDDLYEADELPKISANAKKAIESWRDSFKNAEQDDAPGEEEEPLVA